VQGINYMSPNTAEAWEKNTETIGDNQLTQASSACLSLPGENKKHLGIPMSYLSSTARHFL